MGRDNDGARAIEKAFNRRDVSAAQARGQVLMFLDNTLFSHDRDPYRLFGLTPDCSLDDIRARHKRLLQVFHPDRHPDEQDWFTDRSERLNRAWAYLKTNHGKPGAATIRDTDTVTTSAPPRQSARPAPQRRPRPKTKPQPRVPETDELRRRLKTWLGNPASLQQRVYIVLVTVPAVLLLLLYLNNSSGIETQAPNKTATTAENPGRTTDSAARPDTADAAPETTDVALATHEPRTPDPEPRTSSTNPKPLTPNPKGPNTDAAPQTTDVVLSTDGPLTPNPDPRPSHEPRTPDPEPRPSSTNPQPPTPNANGTTPDTAGEHSTTSENPGTAPKTAELVPAEPTAATDKGAPDTTTQANATATPELSKPKRPVATANPAEATDNTGHQAPETAASTDDQSAKETTKLAATEPKTEAVHDPRTPNSDPRSSNEPRTTNAQRPTPNPRKTDSTKPAKTSAAKTDPEAHAAATPTPNPQPPTPITSIQTLLDTYTNAYNASNIDTFTALFSAGATTKNAANKTEIRRKYNELFQKTSQRKLVMQDAKVKILGNDEYQVKTRYTVDWQYDNGDTNTASGHFNIHLVTINGDLKIQRLDY